MRFWFFYQCSQCGREVRREECSVEGDDTWQWGPELICPHCGGLVFDRHGKSLVVLALTIGLALGLLAYFLWMPAR
jgi:DNA-directed RNA polymerase subunit RPC12/RpoP